MKQKKYSLVNDGRGSDEYYEAISKFTDQILEVAKDLPVENYIRYLKNNKIESVRGPEEYKLELLTLGVLWRTYSHNVNQIRHIPKQFLNELVRIRSNNRSIKPVIYKIRGHLSTVFLSQDSSIKNDPVEPTIENMSYLLDWLSATGEYQQEVIKLEKWFDYFKTESSNLIEISVTFAEWFECRSEITLGKYTGHVNDYLKTSSSTPRSKGGVILSTRRSVEHHLSMVTAEIKYRAFKE